MKQKFFRVKDIVPSERKMSVQSHNHNDDQVECPLCMEPLEMDDLNFFPCTCGYQICRFCWHRIRTDENGLCPACRKPYPENPADFKPLSQEELQRIKQEKRQKDLLRKQKVTENRKHLANVRVVQKNLVFVVGLSARLAETEMLKKVEYFGKFGKIHKVVINHSTAYAGSQGPSASAYVTYQRAEDALKAIQAVNNIYVDGRTLKASLGTTKYCSHFMKNQQCPKSDCMYLHELGDEAASFTKEEMQQGKHQDFEKRLQEQYLGSSAPTEKPNGLCSLSSLSSTVPVSISGGSNISVSNQISKKSKDADGSKTPIEVLGSNVREGWPALSASPPVGKEQTKKSKKSERTRQIATEETGKRNREKKTQKEKTNGTNDDRNTPSVSGSQDSGNSSASAAPPLLQSEESVSSHSNLFKPSSPLPVNNVKSALHYDPENSQSPIGTTPSSLSSCSEPSLSLPNAAISSVPSESIASAFPQTNNYSPEIQVPQNEQPTVNSLAVHPNAESKKSQLPVNTPNGNNNPLDLEWMNVYEQTHSEEPADLWDPVEYCNDIADLSVIERQLDDELGFDPFEETNKALAEDIIIEQKLLEQQKQRQILLQQHMQLQQQQKHLQSMQHQQQLNQAQLYHSSIKSMSDYPDLCKDLSQTRLPPPGFNGLTMSGYSLAQNQQQQSHLPKLAQPFIGGINPQQTMANAGSPPPQQLNGFIGSNKIGVPPGLANNILTAPSSNGMPGMMANGLPTHHMSGPSVLNFEPPFGVGITMHPNIKSNDSFVLKDIETSLQNFRNILPIITSVNSMNSVNNLNTLASGNSHTQAHMSSQNPIANLLSFTHQQHPPFPPHQSLLHQLGSNAMSASHKGWNNSGAADLTALDPAIVSSGQLTDSRTDSPPHWMKSVEQLATEGQSWNNLLPCNLISGALPGTFNGVLPAQTQRTSMWPPTSPPPGFNSISPLHAKQREAHKIEDL